MMVTCAALERNGKKHEDVLGEHLDLEQMCICMFAVIFKCLPRKELVSRLVGTMNGGC